MITYSVRLVVVEVSAEGFDGPEIVRLEVKRMDLLGSAISLCQLFYRKLMKCK